MRVWDVAPGYLNRQSLLGEHRELHGLHSILVHGKTGYARHPETLRWRQCLSGLARRHAHLVAEMRLRGYVDRTPIAETGRRPRWPDSFVTAPWAQYTLLRSKYVRRGRGRIPLPTSAQDLWAHHEYSVMARDQATYRSMRRRLSRLPRGAELSSVAEELAVLLRMDPAPGCLVAALEHMWDSVSAIATIEERTSAHASPGDLLRYTRELAVRSNDVCLMTSTALSELAIFVPARR